MKCMWIPGVYYQVMAHPGCSWSVWCCLVLLGLGPLLILALLGHVAEGSQVLCLTAAGFSIGA